MFTNLATEGAGVPSVLRDFHLKIADQQTGQPDGEERTFFTCLRREAP